MAPHTAQMCGRAAARRREGDICSCSGSLGPAPSLVYGNLTLSFQSGFPREVAQGHLDVLTKARVEQYDPAWEEDPTIRTSFKSLGTKGQQCHAAESIVIPHPTPPLCQQYLKTAPADAHTQSGQPKRRSSFHSSGGQKRKPRCWVPVFS